MWIRIKAQEWQIKRLRYAHPAIRHGNIFRVESQYVRAAGTRYEELVYVLTGGGGRPLRYGNKIPASYCEPVSQLEYWHGRMSDRR